MTNASVRSFRDNGMSCIPEDRYFWGSAPEATLEENSLMGYEDKEAFSHKGLLDLKQVKAHAKQLIEDIKLKWEVPDRRSGNFPAEMPEADRGKGNNSGNPIFDRL